MSILETIDFPFGKYRNTPLSEINDPGYIQWVLRQAENDAFYYADWVQDNEEHLRAAMNYIPRDLPEFNLNEGQARAKEEILNTLIARNETLHRLQGGAGYGKSYAVAPVVIEAKKAGVMVRACATSYVATQNLAKDLDPLGVEAKTIASTLRLDVTHDGPREIYEPGPETLEIIPEILGTGNLLIVDEYSMVDDRVAQILLDGAYVHGGKLLVVGDAWQLPSPAQNWDSVFCKVDPVSTLTQPMRYGADSDLFRVEQIARQNPYQFAPAKFSGSREVQQVRSLDDLINAYVDLYEEYPDQQTIMLWYRRRDMVAANEMIRARLFGPDAQDVCDKENLRVQRTADYKETEFDDATRFYSGTTLRAGDVDQGALQVVIAQMGKTFVIPTTWVETHGLHIPVLFSVTEGQASPDKRGGAEFNAALKEIADWCQENNTWGPYRQFRNSFVQVAYQYASTVHRVQGQSVDNVLTSPAALRMADPYQATKLQYVGLTRAKKRLICL